jgi:hypothetical protein
MTEVVARDGRWTFDDDAVRIVPGQDRRVHKLRQELGEVAVPLPAIARLTYEPGRKGGRLRLRLRDGADPLQHATGGWLSDSASPYQLAIDSDRTGVAEFLADEVRQALLTEQVPDGPCDRYLLPGPPVPLSASAGDGTVTFDGERVRLEWTWMADDAKRSAGPQQFTLAELSGVEWSPQGGMGYGYLRFRLEGAAGGLPPEKDPACLSWGVQKEGGTSALVAAAVVARLPHPSGAAPAEAGDADDPDVLLRRLRELGQLRSDGILTEDEFSAAKQALLRRLG